MLLVKTHRNFLIACVVLLTFNAAQAAINLIGPDKFFADETHPGLAYVNQVDPTVWGLGFGAAALLLGVGMWRTDTFRIARLGIALGLMTCVVRFFLLSYAFDFSVTGLPAWYCAAGMHLACVLEPPFNPSTNR